MDDILADLAAYQQDRPEPIADAPAPIAVLPSGRPTGGRTPEHAALVAEAHRLVSLRLNITALKAGKAPAFPAEYQKDLTPEQITSESIAKIEKGGRVQGMRVQLGAQSMRPDPENPGQFLVLLALETEGAATGNPQWEAAVDSACADLGGAPVKGLWTRAWDTGVLDQTADGERTFVNMRVKDASEIPEAVSAAWADADGASIMMAELLTRDAIVAPSYGHTNPNGSYTRLRGDFATDLPTFTRAEVGVLGMVLARLTDPTLAKPRLELSEHAKRVRAAYNQTKDAAATLEFLQGRGWRILGGALPDEVKLAHPASKTPRPAPHAFVGGTRRPSGSILVVTTNAELPQAWSSPFEIYAYLECDGDGDRAARELAPTLDVAAPAARAAEMPEIIANKFIAPGETVDALVNATITARCADDLSQPLVLNYVPKGSKATGGITSDDDEPGFLLLNRIGQEPTSLSRGGVGSLIMRVAKVLEGHHTREDGTKVPIYARDVPRDVRDSYWQEVRRSERIPVVEQIVYEPTMLADGRIIDKPGLYRTEKILFVGRPGHAERWADYHVSDEPTADEHAEAAKLVREPFVDFPFASPADEARTVAALLSHVMRPQLDLIPGWLINASNMGTGKSLLWKAIAAITTGTIESCDIGTGKKTMDNEAGKRLGAAALRGLRTITVDNAPSEEGLNSLVVTTALTMPFYAVRALGSNGWITVPNMTFFLCGNNIFAGGDLSRRLLQIMLTTPLEWLSTDERDLLHPHLIRWIMANRARLLAAVHTLIRYGIQHPVKPKLHLASFEEWTEVVGTALAHIEIDGITADVLVGEGRDDFADENDAHDDWGDLLEYIAPIIAEHAPDTGWEASRIVEYLRTDSLDPQTHTVYGPLDEVAGFGGAVTPAAARRAGKLLRSIRGTDIRRDNRVLRLVEHRYAGSKKSPRYRVEVRVRDEATGRLRPLTKDEL